MGAWVGASVLWVGAWVGARVLWARASVGASVLWAGESVGERGREPAVGARAPGCAGARAGALCAWVVRA